LIINGKNGTKTTKLLKKIKKKNFLLKSKRILFYIKE